MENSIIGILTKHGVNDYALWQPEVPADDPLLLALLDKYGNSGGSVRGSGNEIRREIFSAMDDGKPCVHVIFYYDPDYDYVGCDVFDSFDAALRQFDSRLRDVRSKHPDDPSWIEDMERDPDKQKLYFRNSNGYEVFYRREELQSEAYAIADCHFCGQPFHSCDLGRRIHRCGSCGKLFCSQCFQAMTGAADYVPASQDELRCPSCELRHCIRQCLAVWLTDYAERMPASFVEAIYKDVWENSGFNKEGGFHEDDVRMAFSRVIAKNFGVKV